MNSALELKRYVDLILHNWNWGEGTCSECPYNLVDKNPDFAFVDSKAEVMVVAQNPGRSGHLGRKRGSGEVTHNSYFWEAVAEAKDAGYDWIDVLDHMVDGTRFQHLYGIYWTNACKCHSDNKKNRGLSTATRHCRDYLVQEVAITRPRLVVSFGEIAARTLIEFLELPIEYVTMERLHGKCIKSLKDDTPVLFFYHWGRRKNKQYKRDVNRRFARVVEDIW